MEDETIPLYSYPIHSEELLAIQNDLGNIQDGLDSIVHGNLSRCTFLNQASKAFFEFLQQLYNRGKTLQQYAQNLMQIESELNKSNVILDSDLLKLRILKADIPSEKEKLIELRHKVTEIADKRQKLAKSIFDSKNKIQSMTTSHNSMSQQIETVSFEMTDNLLDDMSDTNVNIFIQVQRFKDDSEKLDTKIIETQNNIKIHETRLKTLDQNRDSIKLIHESMKTISNVESELIKVNTILKDTRKKQKEERMRFLRFSSELTQIFSQTDVIQKNVKMYKRFHKKFPKILEKEKISEDSFFDTHNLLTEKIKDFQSRQKENEEVEKNLQKEIEVLSLQLLSENSVSKTIESDLESVEHMLEGNKKRRNRRMTEIEILDEKFQSKKLENAMLNYRIMHPKDFEEEIINEKQNIIDKYDGIYKNISNTEFQLGQIRLKIETELMRQNVLEAEFRRLKYFESLINSGENEETVTEMLLQNKKARMKQLEAEKQEFQTFSNFIKIKEKRSTNRKTKLSKRKDLYEQSIQFWSYSDSLELDSNNSPKLTEKLQKRMKLLNAYIRQLSNAFRSQSKYWKENMNTDDVYRAQLVDWAVQVDQINKKLLTSHSKPVISNDENLSLSYSEL